ncbi:NAD(P)-dependent dehydrogenase (short-subunit alcohol dehydrogenase family) [Alicyclobacillus sacchari]|uniref:NAD(P)-dependent dehydrogenase (Short-subunit alcohol dehydrogenase family) n=1 Tax=Alicyclobacillus sacchari TaxID=392010 RepID=A0A4V3HE63_9BACL|nr:glucose 1-dehydrogenase [Alicyclobacillus sacchari]TDY44603.1 NAD(P)-dependent dehydrogenase (short-subunit alcohol dehydrogenase family) [Alicyclobacillus sacchari]GMA57959.1 oxidoreductase [Alicyclobacillus sacchari]
MDQRIVIVTGGGQGIGRGVVEAFWKTGDRVVIAEVDDEAGQESEMALAQRQGPGEAWFVHTDVASEESVSALVQSVVKRYGRIDVVVNNAALGAPNIPLEDLAVAVWDEILGVNLRGPFLMAKHTAPWLRTSNGCIVNIASTRALMSEANTEPYSASKGGILALTHALAISLGPDIRVNAISPGWIEVGNWKKQSQRTQPVHRPIDRAQHPVGRVGVPDDIAQACLFLASSASSFMTGQNLVIDGGMTIKMIYEPDDEVNT